MKREIELPESDDPGRFEIWTDEYRVWVHPLSKDVCVQLYQSGFTVSQAEGLAAAIIAAAEASQ